MSVDRARWRALKDAVEEAARAVLVDAPLVALGLLLRMQSLVDERRALAADEGARAQHLGYVVGQLIAHCRAGQPRAATELGTLLAHFDRVEALWRKELGAVEDPLPVGVAGRAQHALPTDARPLHTVLLGVARQLELVRELDGANFDLVRSALARNAALTRAGCAALEAGGVSAALDAWLAYLEGWAG